MITLRSETDLDEQNKSRGIADRGLNDESRGLTTAPKKEDKTPISPKKNDVPLKPKDTYETLLAKMVYQAAKSTYNADIGFPYPLGYGKFINHKLHPNLKPKSDCPVSSYTGCTTHCNQFVCKFLETLLGKTLSELYNSGILPSTDTNANGFIDYMQNNTSIYSKVNNSTSKENPQSAKEVAFEMVKNGKVVIASCPGHVALLISPQAIEDSTVKSIPRLANANAKDPLIYQCGTSNGIMLLSEGFGNRTVTYYHFTSFPKEDTGG
jgi:hypothetical protein